MCSVYQCHSLGDLDNSCCFENRTIHSPSKILYSACAPFVILNWDYDWASQRDKKLKKFQKGIPHMEELDKIFRHMESPSLCYKCGSNRHSCSTSKMDLGYHHSQSSKQLSLSRGVPGYLDLLDELEKGGVNPNCADYFTATNLLRCPQLRTVYSRRASIDEKVTMLRELREQVCYCCLVNSFS